MSTSVLLVIDRKTSGHGMTPEGGVFSLKLLRCAAIGFLASILVMLRIVAGQDIQAKDYDPSDEAAIRTLAREITREPYEVLATLNIGESELHFLEDGKPLVADERSTLIRLLNRIPLFSREQLQKWQSWDVDWNTIASHPQLFRGAFCELRGHVTSIGVEEVPEVLQDQFPFRRYYLLQIELEQSADRWQVFVRTLPKTWRERLSEQHSWNEQVVLSGMFLKLAEPPASGRTFVFVADRPAWFPDERSEWVDANNDLQTLARYGVDIGQFLEMIDRQRWRPEEREPFYQTLQAVSQIPSNVLSSNARQAEIAELLLEPQSSRGQFFTIRGQARRAVRVEVENEEMRQKYGVDHFFEVDVFVDSEQLIVVPVPEDPTGESNKKFSRYPVVLCVRALPAGMPTGESIHETVSVTGVYAKQWGYHTEYMEQGVADTNRLQISPLLIANTLAWQPYVPTQDPWGTWLAGGLFLTLVLAIVITLVWFARDDRRSSRRRSTFPEGG
jgi:hypothetical protein